MKGRKMLCSLVATIAIILIAGVALAQTFDVIIDAKYSKLMVTATKSLISTTTDPVIMTVDPALYPNPYQSGTTVFIPLGYSGPLQLNIFMRYVNDTADRVTLTDSNLYGWSITPVVSPVGPRFAHPLSPDDKQGLFWWQSMRDGTYGTIPSITLDPGGTLIRPFVKYYLNTSYGPAIPVIKISTGNSLPSTLTIGTRAQFTFQIVNKPIVVRTTPPTNAAPVVNAGQNLSVVSDALVTTVLNGNVTDADTSDALQYKWREGSTDLTSWAPTAGPCPLDLSYLYMAPGQHTLSLDATDGKVTVSDDMLLSVDNAAPKVAPKGGGRHKVGDIIALGGEISDFDGDVVVCQWRKKGSTTPDCFDSVQTIRGGQPVILPECLQTDLNVGVHTVEIEANDGLHTVIQEVAIEIVDVTPPKIAPVVSPAILWPPNHKMVSVVVMANAVDDSGLPVALTVGGVTSNEPQEGLGDGDVAVDWNTPVINQNTGEISIQLRAERSGSGSGREYSIPITATDVYGNFSQFTAKAFVPHDQGNK